MNFLFVSKDFKNGGVEKVFLSYATYLNDSSNKIDFFILDQQIVPHFNNIDLNSESYLKKLFSLRNTIKKGNYDKIIVAKEGAAFFLFLSTLLLNVNICFTRHAALNSAEQKISKKIVGLLYFFYSLKKNSSIFCVSKNIANDLSFYIGEEKLNVIPNPIYEKNKFDAVNISKNIIEDELYFVAVGRLIPLKGFDFLISSYSQALKVNKELPVLLIIGDGPEFNNLSNLIKNLGLEGRVKLLGYLDDPLPIISKSLLFILSSRSEGMPTVLIEALILKVPVLATDCISGPKELLEEYGGGTLVAVDDQNGMKNSILGYRDIQNISDECHKKLKKYFSIENSINTLLGIK